MTLLDSQIDIWSEMPKESGVFENKPAAHKEGVIVSGMYSDDEEEEGSGEEEWNHSPTMPLPHL